MRISLITILLVVLFNGCESSKNPNKQKTQNNVSNNDISFKEYLNTLDEIELPFKHSTTSFLPKLSKEFNEVGFKEYRHCWSTSPHGILFKDGKIITLIDYSISDLGHAPFIMTYTDKGVKIDSLSLLIKSGFDMGYEGYEFILINNQKEIIINDSIRQWQLNDNENNIIESSLKISKDTTIYIISNTGAIVKKQ